MILLLILFVLLAIAGGMFAGVALRVAGAAVGLVLVLIFAVVRRRKR